METPQTIAPREGENSHLDSHKLINVAILSFTKEINSLTHKIDNIKQEDLGKYLSENLDAFSKKIKNIELLVESKLDTILEKIGKPIKKQVIIKEYSGIIDTDSENIVTLEKIEFQNQGPYKIDIIIVKADQNANTSEIKLPIEDISYGFYTPVIGIRSINNKKAVLEYKFKVLVHEI